MKGAQNKQRKTSDFEADDEETMLEILEELKRIDNQVGEIEKLADIQNAKKPKRAKPAAEPEFIINLS